MITNRNRINSHLIIILLAIHTRVANLYRNYGYFIICISLFITLSSASPLSPPIEGGGGEACSMSDIT